MKKKVLLVLVLAALVGGGVIAQETEWNSYAPAVANNKLFVNAGIGFGPTGGWDMGIPPISASVDYKLPIPAPITVGAVATFTTWKWASDYGYVKVDVTYTNIGIGGRGMYHFNFMEKLDTYAGLTIGYVIQSVEAKASSDYPSVDAGYDEGASFLLYGVNIGARYFFTDLLGAYLELGYSGLQYAGVGVSLKF